MISGGEDVPSTGGDGGVLTTVGVKNEDIANGGRKCRIRCWLEEGGDERFG